MLAQADVGLWVEWVGASYSASFISDSMEKYPLPIEAVADLTRGPDLSETPRDVCEARERQAMIESLEVTLSRTAVWAAQRGDDALEMVMRSVETTLLATANKQSSDLPRRNIMSGDPIYNLQRFLDAQADTYDAALSELKAGRKKTHWMWYIFPQLAGLGRSALAERFAIRSVDEAAAYLGHPVLGSRLLRCVEAVLAITGVGPNEIFGFPDDMKFRSSMTLFAVVAENGSPFHRAIDHLFDGDFDEETRKLLKADR